jgi:hypothetical protein
MLIRETREALLRMLAREGRAPSATAVPSPEAFLGIFREFAAIAVEDAGSLDQDGDGVLAQFGTYTFRGAPEFSVDMTRQFMEGDDPDAPMWQLNCTFHWQPTTQTDELGHGNVWSFGKPLSEFFDEARALPGWAWALDAPAQPTDLEITLEEV